MHNRFHATEPFTLALATNSTTTLKTSSHGFFCSLSKKTSLFSELLSFDFIFHMQERNTPAGVHHQGHFTLCLAMINSPESHKAVPLLLLAQRSRYCKNHPFMMSQRSPISFKGDCYKHWPGFCSFLLVSLESTGRF